MVVLSQGFLHSRKKFSTEIWEYWDNKKDLSLIMKNTTLK